MAYRYYKQLLKKLKKTPALDIKNTRIRVPNYSKFYIEKVSYFKDAFAKSGAGVIDCRVDESYVKKLLGYFKRRG